MADKPTRDEVLKRMLRTPPEPQKEVPKRRQGDAEPMPDDDPKKLVEWGKKHLQDE